MKNILNVLRFEYKGFVSTKSFRVVSIIFVVAILIATSLPQIIGAFSSTGIGEGFGKENKAALILSGEALTNEKIRDAFSQEVFTGTGTATWVDLSDNPPDDQTLSQAIINGDYVFALRYSGGTEFEISLPGNNMLAQGSVGALQSMITELAREGEISALPSEQQEAARSIIALEATPIIKNIGGDAESNYWIGYVLIMFLFYVIMGYSNYVSSSVVTEKTSKAMELLITSVKPIHLMVGKVIGVGLAALTQVAILIASFAIGIMINIGYWRETGNVLLSLTQGENVGASIAIIVIVYFLCGFFLYAFLVAAFSSTVTRPEEAATVITLPMVFIMLSLMVGFLTLFGVMSKTVIAALSYFPFFTPVVMIARYTVGDAGTAQLALGAVIMVVAIILVAILSAKIFRMGSMLYGVKATPKQLFKALKSS